VLRSGRPEALQIGGGDELEAGSGHGGVAEDVGLELVIPTFAGGLGEDCAVLRGIDA